MKKGIIVLGANGLAKLDTIKRIHSHNISIILICEYIDNPNSDFYDYLIKSDMSSIDKMVSDIYYFLHNHLIQIVTCTSFTEFHVETAALLNNYFELKGHSYKSVKIARNKYLTKVELKKSQECVLYVPGFNLIRAVEDIRQLEFKNKSYIIKPLNCTASYGIYKVNSKNEMVQVFHDFKGNVEKKLEQKMNTKVEDGYLMAEEYIDGFEISAESVTYGGKTYTYAIHDKISPVEAPYFLETCCVTKSERITESLEKVIKDVVRKILNAINYEYGITHIEFRIKDGIPYLIEINVRPGGGMIFESVFYSTGINMIEEYLRAFFVGKLSSEICSNVTICKSIYPSIGRIRNIFINEDILNDTRIKEKDVSCYEGEIITTPEVCGTIELLISGYDLKSLLNFTQEVEKKILIINEKAEYHNDNEE